MVATGQKEKEKNAVNPAIVMHKIRFNVCFFFKFTK